MKKAGLKKFVTIYLDTFVRACFYYHNSSYIRIIFFKKIGLIFVDGIFCRTVVTN